MLRAEEFYPMEYCKRYHEHWARLGTTSMEGGMEEGVKVKKGYSIWSLLVIMTLLAFVLVLPKTMNLKSFFDHNHFATYHQVSLWLLVGILIWMLSGKSRIVLGVQATFMLVIWGPMIVAIVEQNTYGDGDNPIVRSVLETIGLFEVYDSLYQSIFHAFEDAPY